MKADVKLAAEHLITTLSKADLPVNEYRKNEYLCRKLFDTLVAEGYELSKVPFEEWCDRVSAMDDSNASNGQSSVKRMLEAVTNSRFTHLSYEIM